MVNPAPAPATGMARKVKMAALMTYLLFAGLLAICKAAGMNVDVIISAFPDWANVFVTPLVPAIITAVTGWVTKHAPQDLNLAVKERQLR